MLPLPALKAVLEEYLLTITRRLAQVDRLDELIAAQVPPWKMYPAVQALMCLRGEAEDVRSGIGNHAAQVRRVDPAGPNRTRQVLTVDSRD